MTLQINQKVRIIHITEDTASEGAPEDTVGDVGIVVSTGNSLGGIRVLFDYDDYWYYDINDLEVME